MARSIERLVNHTLDCDVLVVGGGCAGLFSAIKARESGKKVILVDKRICRPERMQHICSRGHQRKGR